MRSSASPKWIHSVVLLSLLSGCVPPPDGTMIPLPTGSSAGPTVQRVQADPSIPAIPSFPTELPSGGPKAWILKGRAPTHQAELQALFPELSTESLMAATHKLASYENRWYQSIHGVNSALWILEQFVRHAQGRGDVEIEVITHNGYPQPSIIARIKGTGPNAAEKVILGGHADTITSTLSPSNPNALAPGADDNASGIAVILETFRVLAKSGFKPGRTLEFIAYAAEEPGRLGSQYIANLYQKQKKQVVAVMQLDGTMYAGPAGSTPKLTFINDFDNADLTNFTTRLADTYIPEIPWDLSKCNYACSDHASWTFAGYPSTFPYEGAVGVLDNVHIHTDQDTIDRLSPEHGMLFAKLALAFMVELAD